MIFLTKTTFSKSVSQFLVPCSKRGRGKTFLPGKAGARHAEKVASLGYHECFLLRHVWYLVPIWKRRQAGVSWNQAAWGEFEDLKAGRVISIVAFKQKVSQLLTSYSTKGPGEKHSYLDKLVRGMPKRLQQCKKNKYGPMRNTSPWLTDAPCYDGAMST